MVVVTARKKIGDRAIAWEALSCLASQGLICNTSGVLDQQWTLAQGGLGPSTRLKWIGETAALIRHGAAMMSASRRPS